MRRVSLVSGPGAGQLTEAEKLFRKKNARGGRDFPNSVVVQFVFLNFVVNAAGSDSHKSCSLSLIAMSEL
jgi:hypothetical protein